MNRRTIALLPGRHQRISRGRTSARARSTTAELKGSQGTPGSRFSNESREWLGKKTG